jgi:hypothetical protein
LTEKPLSKSTDGSGTYRNYDNPVYDPFEKHNKYNNPLYDDGDGDGDVEGGKKKRLVRKPLDKCTILELKERAARRRINIKGLKTKAEILAKMRK